METSGLHPYMFWQTGPNTRLWFAAGQSEGDATTQQAGGETTTTGVRMRMGSAGLSQALYVWRGEGGDNARLNFKLDGAYGSSELGAEQGKTRHRNVRALFELRHSLSRANGARLQPFAEAGLRYAENGESAARGWEISGGLRYRNGGALSAWSWELLGGALRLRGDGKKYKSWSVSGALRKSAVANGAGWSFSLSPQYAPTNAQSLQSEMWQSFAAPAASGDAARVFKLNVEARYGWLGANALWTPYAGATYEGGEASALRFGADWESRARADMQMRAKMEVLRREEKTETQLRLQANY